MTTIGDLAFYMSNFDIVVMLPLFMMVFAVLIGISRMYLAVHFPTDVLVGAIVGIVITAFSKAVISPHILSIAIQTLNLWLYC